MKLIDPTTQLALPVSVWAKLKWISKPLATWHIRQARKSARRLDWPNAITRYRRALRMDSSRAAAWVQLGNAFGQSNKAEAAQYSYRNATIADPNYAIGHRQLGMVLRGTDDHLDGMTELGIALLLNPDDQPLRDLLTQMEGEAGTEALLVRAALTLTDRYPSGVYIGLRATLLRKKARRAARLRQWDEAARLYKIIAALSPDDPLILIQLGHALNEQGHLEDAERAYRLATKGAPLLADAWLFLGYCLLAQAREEAAQEAFRMVDRIAPLRAMRHSVVADSVASTSASPSAVLGKSKLVCPPELGRREAAVWMTFAAHIEGDL